jgi:hypothetical protein
LNKFLFRYQEGLEESVPLVEFAGNY